MPSPAELATLNLERARDLRASGASYRDIGRELGLTSNQLSHIRRTLKRAKAAQTRLHSANPDGTVRDLPVSQCVLPAGLRKRLSASGFRTLGDLADRLSDPELPGLESLPGIGPHRTRLVKGLLDHFELLAGRDDLQSAVEDIFPDLRHAPSDQGSTAQQTVLER